MYHAPNDLTEALEIMRAFDGMVVAGGTDVFPSTMQGQRSARFLDITRIPSLNTLSHGPGGTRFGSTLTWSQIVAADLPPAFDALKQAAVEVGSVQIQNAGTIAGNLCNASPAADGVPPLLALDASVEVVSQARGTRQIPLSEFVLGVRKTALGPDELVTAITIPPTPKLMGSAFEKLGSRRYLVISITMTAALVSCNARGRISDVRLAVGACSPVAKRLPDLEDSLIGQLPANPHIDQKLLSGLAPIDDVRGTKGFRLDVVAQQCVRAIRRAAGNG